MPIRDKFLQEQLLHITTPTPWFADICNFVAASQFLLGASRLYRERLQNDAKYYIWDDPYLWRLCNDQVIRRCIPDAEINSVLHFCYTAPEGGHYGSTRTTRKVLDCGFYWPTIFRDTYHFVSTCEKCQKGGMAISRRHEMPQQPILFCEVFDVWGIDFMGPFPVSNGYSYILLALDYIGHNNKTNDAKVVVDFLKSNIFCWFGMPKALISDQGSHFCNRAMSALLNKIVIAYHPQTNGQAEVFNREIKKTLQKMTNLIKKDWSRLLEDTLWARRTAPNSVRDAPLPDCLRCKNWMNSASKPMRTLGSISRKSSDFMTNRVPSRLQSKLRSRWDEPFVITNVNGHQIKLFHEGPTPIAGDMETISLMEPAPPNDTL
ncbi:putative mitochondrial protein, partial [Mucuna pruriens]